MSSFLSSLLSLAFPTDLLVEAESGFSCNPSIYRNPTDGVVRYEGKKGKHSISIILWLNFTLLVSLCPWAVSFTKVSQLFSLHFVQLLSSLTQVIVVVALSVSHVQLFATPWMVARQAPLSMGFPGKNTRMGCHFLLQGIFLTQDSNPRLLHWQADSLPLSHSFL